MTNTYLIATATKQNRAIRYTRENADTESGLVYYNYRYSSFTDRRRIGRTPHKNLSGSYTYLNDSSLVFQDYLRLISSLHAGVSERLVFRTALYEGGSGNIGKFGIFYINSLAGAT